MQSTGKCYQEVNFTFFWACSGSAQLARGHPGWFLWDAQWGTELLPHGSAARYLIDLVGLPSAQKLMVVFPAKDHQSWLS